MGVLDGGGDRRRVRGSLRVNVGRPIETNRKFVAYSCARETRPFQITLKKLVAFCFDVLREIHDKKNIPTA